MSKEEIRQAAERHDKLINFQVSQRIKSMAQQTAIRRGMSLSTYIRGLIIQDNER